MKSCECGCGSPVDGVTRHGPRRFVSGHNIRGIERTAQYKAAIGAGQRRAWATKRTRSPIGSENLDTHGYVRVKVADGVWIKQHKLVMEAAIGRALNKTEQVHHINGVRSDNRIENLFLCRNSAEHQQVEHSMAVAFRALMEAGVARFNHETGRYEGVLQR